MSGALSELLTREVADGGGGPSGVAPGPDAPGAPQGARIVGRATDVLVDGSHRHSFLLFEPPRSYSWLTETGMRADPALLALLTPTQGQKATIQAEMALSWPLCELEGQRGGGSTACDGPSSRRFPSSTQRRTTTGGCCVASS